MAETTELLEYEGYISLPAHERDENGACTVCGHTDTWATYEEYVEHFFTHEYEGEPGHEAHNEELFMYLRDACLGAGFRELITGRPE